MRHLGLRWQATRLSAVSAQASDTALAGRGAPGHDKQRLHVLAMLLEAVGLKKTLSLCPPEAVRAALGAPKSEI
jgi:hypothetical protein